MTVLLSLEDRVQARSRGGRSADSHEDVRRFCGSRRDQEEGGGAGLQRWTSFASLFPNGGATDIIFVTLFCIAVGTAVS